VPDLRRHAVRTLALTAVVAFGLAVAVSSRDSRADIDPATAVLRVLTRGLGRPIAPGFVGFSLEYHTLLPYTGNNSRRIDPVLVRLIRELTPGQHPVLRIGGDSTDWTWAPTQGLRRPGGIEMGQPVGVDRVSSSTVISPVGCSTDTDLRAPAGCNCVLKTTELTFTGACFNSGTAIFDSNVPILPVAFSRTTTLIENRPGGSVTPV